MEIIVLKKIMMVSVLSAMGFLGAMDRSRDPYQEIVENTQRTIYKLLDELQADDKQRNNNIQNKNEPKDERFGRGCDRNAKL